MLRLSVPTGTRLEMAHQLDVYPAGAEANVAAALARLGYKCGWVSALPNHALGRLVAYRRYGRPGWIVRRWRGTRDGLAVILSSLPLPHAQPRSSMTGPELLLHPSASRTNRLGLSVGYPFAPSDGYHATPRPHSLLIVREAIRQARERGVAVSFDVNFRSKLWSAEAAASVLHPLMQQVDLLFCSGRDARNLFACTGIPMYHLVTQLVAQQPEARQVVVTLADQGVIGWDGTQIISEAARPVGIVDRIGAGDALAGVVSWLVAGGFRGRAPLRRHDGGPGPEPAWGYGGDNTAGA